MRRGAGWPTRATTRRWAPGRWREPSRSTSSGRWPKSCCSAAWRTAVTCVSRLPRMARSWRCIASRRRYRPYPRRGLAAAVDDAALGQVVGGHFHGDRIAGEDANVVFAHLARDVRGHDVAVLQLHPKSRIRQGLDDLAFHLDRIFFGHTSLSDVAGANWSTKVASKAICAHRALLRRAAATAGPAARAAAAGTAR